MFSSYAVFLIPIVAILAWGVHGVVREIYKGKARVADAARGGASRAGGESSVAGVHDVVREVYKGKASVAEAGNSDIKQALDETVAANKLVLAKLESIETRLASVEKTLNDIPS